jgi:hypothetical protein
MKDHVILGNNAYWCLHCNATYALQLPMSLNMLSAIAGAFLKDHENCKPKAEQKEPML